MPSDREQIGSTDRVWESVLLLLETPGLDVQRLREALLETLRAWRGADSAALIPFSGRNPDCASARTVGQPRDWERDLRVLEGSWKHPLPYAGAELHGESLGLFRLQVQGRRLALVALAGPAPAPPLPAPLELRRLAQALALAELVLQQRVLLESTQKRLEKLRSDSRRIAEGNQRLFQQLSSNQDRLRGVSQGVIRVQEDERSKVSRELHDGLGQALTALKINLELLGVEMEEKLTPEGLARLADTRVLAEEAIEEVRELSRLLRPRILDELGLSPTLSWYARTFGKRTGLDIEIDDRCDGTPLSWEAETLIFRVTQEALNNIVKHSGSPTAQVRLECGETVVRLQISDQGSGFEAGQAGRDGAGGSGLPGMRDRVSLLGGRLRVESRSGQGTTLTIEIPRRETR